MKATVAEPSFAELVCLTLIIQGVAHGWALGTMLAPDGELGRIWTLSRPLTYRAIDGLADKGLAIRRGPSSGHGRDRVWRSPPPRPAGAPRRGWLDAPVQHLRDVRTELLVKLTLRERAGLDNERAPRRPAGGLRARRSTGSPRRPPTTTSSTSGAGRAPGRSAGSSTRRSTRPIRRAEGRPELRLSARNQLRGTITAVQHGEVMSTIKAVLGDGQPLTAAITKEAARDLDLAPGDHVLIVIKSTEVMVAKAP